MEIIEVKNTIASKNSVDGLSSKAEMTQDRIIKLEDRSTKFFQSEQQRQSYKNINSIGNLWDHMKRASSQSHMERRENMGLKNYSQI